MTSLSKWLALPFSSNFGFFRESIFSSIALGIIELKTLPVFVAKYSADSMQAFVNSFERNCEELTPFIFLWRRVTSVNCF
jgi:hypothetical protein